MTNFSNTKYLLQSHCRKNKGLSMTRVSYEGKRNTANFKIIFLKMNFSASNSRTKKLNVVTNWLSVKSTFLNASHLTSPQTLCLVSQRIVLFYHQPKCDFSEIVGIWFLPGQIRFRKNVAVWFMLGKIDCLKTSVWLEKTSHKTEINSNLELMDFFFQNQKSSIWKINLKVKNKYTFYFLLWNKYK